MKVFLASFILLTTLSLKAQTEKIYYDKNWKKVSNKDSAAYYREAAESEGKLHGIVKDYYISGKIQMEGNFEKGVEDGIFTYYYENGLVSSKGEKKYGFSNGAWEYWYENGKLREKRDYGKLPVTEDFFTMMDFYDSTGKHIIKNGTGEYSVFYHNKKQKEKGKFENGKRIGKWKAYYENGSLKYEETYKKGELENGKFYTEDGKVYKYTELQVQPEYLGGMAKMSEYLGKNIKYPKDAMDNNISGRVFIEFVVNEEGKVCSAWVKRGVYFSLDEEALRVVEQMPDWDPGRYRGKPVKVRFILPVKFTL